MVYFKCKEPWYFRSECPNLEKLKKKVTFTKKDKKKVLISTRKNLHTSDWNEEYEEEANLCLVANNVKYSSEEYDEKVDFNDLHSIVQAYNKLLFKS